MIPVIETERLTLRAPAVEDFEPYASIFASERSVHMDGPLPPREAWREFASGVAVWHLRGYGPFSIARRQDGAYLGEAGLFHPPAYPEPELGWMLLPEAEGRGYAQEAARAIRAWFYHARGAATLVSYIAPRNARSIRLAERLGARLDEAAARPEGDTCLVYRHPGSEALP